MKKLLSQIFSNRVKTFVLSLIAITGLATGTVFAGYGPNGPERPIYDFSNPAQREGSFDGPRFNSYINTNVYGDERAFLDAKECVAANDSCYTQGQAGGYADQQPVQAGKEYIIRAYVHNIAHPSTNGTNMDGIGVAKNTRIRFEMPEGMANGFTMQARISADNAKPQMVYDTVDLKNDTTPFDIDYVPGSARIYNSAHPTGLTLSDNIMGANGVQIGHDQMNGVYPGCFEYASFVVIRVKAKTNQVDFKKQVRKAGVQEWSKITNVKPGEKIQWVLTFQNKGQTTFDDVTLSDQLPPHVTLVPGSVRYIDAAQDVPQQDRPLFTTGGINFSTWKPNGGFHVRFDTVAKDDFAACEVTVRNLGFYKTKQTPTEKQDYADVKITKENCQPTKPPVTTVTTPPKPTELPKTGAGSVVGIFSAVSMAGAVAHRYFIGRRFN
jgi:uncharacterized repeat protein (TIGR01451 family)